MTRSIRVLLADKHLLLYAGLASTFEREEGLRLVGHATDRHGLMETCQVMAPDLLLLALNVPDMPLPCLLEQLQARQATLRVILLLDHDRQACLSDSVKHGAHGCVLKSDSAATLVNAVYAVANGNTWFSQPLVQEMIRQQQQPHRLTDRELLVLHHVTAEMTDAEIARLLGVAERTVRYYLRKIYDKLGVNSRVGAAVQAVQRQLISL